MAESICALSLRLRGYTLLARNLRTPVGEIDILARRRGILVIVEVKSRRDADDAALAMTPRQQQRLVRAAEYVRAGRADLRHCDVRFDVMLVGRWHRPVHLVDAWRPAT